MPIPDFRKAPPINLEEIMELFKVAMPRFDIYFEGTAELEKRLGDWKEAANQAIKEGNSAAPRATLDKIISEVLTRMRPGVTHPKNLYELVYEDIERLRKIMEHELRK